MTSSDKFKNDRAMLDLLPDELILNILSHLTLPDLALGLWPLGNKRLRRICKDPKFCTSVNFPASWDSDTICKVASMVAGPSLKELGTEKRDNDDFYSFSKLVMRRSPNLEWIKTHAVPSEALFVAIATHGDSVRKLSLEERNYAPKNSDAIFTNVASLRKLTWISIRGLFFDNDVLIAIADNCEQLAHLKMNTLLQLADQTFSYFLGKVRGTLKHLALGDLLDVTDNTFNDLRQCQILEELVLMDIGLLDVKCLTAIAALPNLQKLGLQIARHSPSGLDYTEIFTGSKTMKNLTSLRMIGCWLDDSATDAIAGCCPNLEHLDLSWNKMVGDLGVISVISQCKNLIGLWLKGTGVTAKAFFFIDGSSSKVSHLKYLEVSEDVKLEVARLSKNKCDFFRLPCNNRTTWVIDIYDVATCGCLRNANLKTHSGPIPPSRGGVRCENCGCSWSNHKERKFYPYSFWDNYLSLYILDI